MADLFKALVLTLLFYGGHVYFLGSGHQTLAGIFWWAAFFSGVVTLLLFLLLVAALFLALLAIILVILKLK